MVKKVLLVDDDGAMLQLLQEGFSGYAHAFGVLTAADGAEALGCIQRQEVALVVTDLKMPRMDGFELLAAVMDGYPDIPVIVMTGFHAPGIESMVRRAGAVGFIVKPFGIDVLAQQILDLLQRQAEGGSLHNVSTAMFLQLIEMEQKTCTIRLAHRASGERGVLFFVEGGLVDARLGEVKGAAAALKMVGWEDVSLSIQNGCAVRERRIRPELNQLILEAMRRKDEAAAAPGGAPAPPPAEERPLERLRARVQSALGAHCQVEDLIQGRDWSGRIKRISACGERLNLGPLALGYVVKDDGRNLVLLASAEGAVVAVSPGCPRDALLGLLAE
ncbi:MAG: response regulator [Desulfobacterales bacterium]|nr:response regulator [Desulfobacterales bacterium]